MNDNTRKATTRSTSRPATSNVNKSNPEATKREVNTKLDEAGLENLIRAKAYSIWEAKGRHHGSDVEIWLQAKKEILSQLKKSS